MLSSSFQLLFMRLDAVQNLQRGLTYSTSAAGWFPIGVILPMALPFWKNCRFGTLIGCWMSAPAWAASSSTCVRQHQLVDEPDKVRPLLEAAGLTCGAIWTLPYEREWNSQLLLSVQQSCGTPGRRLATLSPTDQAACIERVRRRVQVLLPPD